MLRMPHPIKPAFKDRKWIKVERPVMLNKIFILRLAKGDFVTDLLLLLIEPVQIQLRYFELTSERILFRWLVYTFWDSFGAQSLCSDIQKPPKSIKTLGGCHIGMFSKPLHMAFSTKIFHPTGRKHFLINYMQFFKTIILTIWRCSIRFSGR